MLISSTKRFGLLPVLLILILHLNLSAQPAYDLGEFSLEGNVYEWSDNALGLQKNGLLLGEYRPQTMLSQETHPFFGDPAWQSGTINYRDRVFEEVHMLYNVHEDVLVMRHPSQMAYFAQPIEPNQDQVDWFELYGHIFKYYDQNVFVFSAGYYDMIFEGDRMNVIAKRSKDTRAERAIVFVDANRYFIEYGGEFHRLRKRTFLKLMADDKKQVRSFIKQNDLKIKPGNDADLARLAIYCDELLTNNQ